MSPAILAAAALLGAGLAAAVAARTTMVPPMSGRLRILTQIAITPLLAALLLLTDSGVSLWHLAASTLALAVLVGATLNDLRERFVDILSLSLGTLLVILLLAAERGDLPGGALLGVGVGVALSGLLFAGGWLFARLRGAGIDPETGERVEDVGSGDIFAWALAGAWLGGLGGPGAVVAAFLAQLFLNGFISAGALVWARMRRHDGDLHLPMLPSIVIATVAVAIWGAQFGG